MKKFYILTLALAACFVACNKAEAPAGEPASGQEIVLNVDDENVDLSVDTKTTAVTSMPSSLCWGATTGAVGSEAIKYHAEFASVSSSKINTGKYQTATPTSYNYYVANLGFVQNGTSKHMEFSAANTTDVVAGHVASQTTTTPSVTLNHIFARTGTLSASAATSGVTASNVTWKIVGKSTINGTAGTYDLTSAAWTASSSKLSSQTTLTSSSDMYLIPGTYTVYITYTLTQGDWTATYTKHADVTLVGGKINNISATLPGGGTQIVITVSLTGWGSNDISIPAANLTD